MCVEDIIQTQKSMLSTLKDIKENVIEIKENGNTLILHSMTKEKNICALSINITTLIQLMAAKEGIYMQQEVIE